MEDLTAGDFHTQIFQLFLVLIAKEVVATFHLYYLGHRVKYGNPEVGNTNNFCQQHDQAAVLSLLNHFYFESFSSHVIQVYICIYIDNVSYFIFFLLSSTVTLFLHCMLNVLRYEKILPSRLLHSTIHQVMWYFWVFIVNPFFLLCSIFFSRKLYFLWSPCLLLIANLFSLDTSCKTTVEFFLKITSPSWIIIVNLTW